jgi:membrane fusion protein, heavy metal efflux system
MFRTTITLFAVFVLTISAAWAGPGHDHGEEAPAPVTNAAPRLESVGATMELVATSDGHHLIMYLDHPDTSEPIEGASIEVSGEGIPTALAKPIGPGTYELEAEWVDQPGTKALVFTVTTKTDADLLNGTWSVPEAGHAAPSDGSAAPLLQVLSRPDILALLGGTLALGFVLAFALRSRSRQKIALGDDAAPTAKAPAAKSTPLRSAAEVILIAALIGSVMASPALAGPGHDHGDGGHDEAPAAAGGNTPRKLPGGGVFVPKSTQRLLGLRTKPAEATTSAQTRELIGTVVPDPSSFGQVQAPMDGQIEVSERGISYAGQKVQAGEVLALLSPSIPVADLGTMQQLRAEVDGKLIIAEQKLDRLTRIASVVAKSQIDDTKAELAALREQKRVLEPKDTQKIALKAPVSGIISVANVRAGQVVTARDTLFEIVDPDKLWVEGIGDAGHGDGLISTATAVDSEGHSLKLSYVGRSPTLRQQARPFLFRIEDAHPELVIGAPVKVFVQSEGTAQGIELPLAAVVRGNNGLPQVWIKESPERFRPAEVKTQPLDGERLLVLAGIKPGDRVVTSAAELINQIR